MILSSLFYYLLYSSAVLLYGVGLERTTILSKHHKDLSLKFVKMLICVSSTSALSFLFINNLLVVADLAELYPFFIILIYIAISVFVESIIRITAKISAAEFSCPLLFVFIALSESANLAECVIISCICILSLYICIPFIYSINRRMALNRKKQEYEKIGFGLTSIAIICIIILCWNVTWLNEGVFQ